MNQHKETTNRFATHTNRSSIRTAKIQRILTLACVLLILSIMGIGCDSGGVQPPATVTFRESMLDSTRVMQVTNRSGSETLVMKLDAYNDTSHQHGEHVFKLSPGETYEIGRLEMGWVFLRGERFTLAADGYVIPIKGTVP